MAAKTLKMGAFPDVVVSMFSVRLLNLTPLDRSRLMRFSAVLHATAKPIELPHDECVPFVDGVEHMVQTGPVCLRAGRMVGVNIRSQPVCNASF
ncbi:MAG: hypothetical protein ABF805_09070 [Bifidobacterium sp.]|uniref:Uncharacterized protein n=1 Tax=Bifidobacterium aquikefiricola TaxID=3059038 RepID=A0AB39U6B6_9BIFI